MKQYIERGPHQAICQKWEESELGWGVRPDGFSLHLTCAGLSRFVKEHWDMLPARLPAEYSRPSGKPFAVEVSSAIIAEVEAAGGNLQYPLNYEYPSPSHELWAPAC
ncbi:MAG TPA: hypothetical protein VF733_03315 [Candidatus Saccharimonadales bacterium]